VNEAVCHETTDMINFMKRYQLVHSLSWEKSVCSMLFESNDVEVIETLETKVSETLNDRYEVIDAWDNRNQFPASAKPLLKSEQEVYKWLAKEAKQKNAPATPK